MDAVDDLYRIGTIANLTGIAVERLRAWERRYGLEPAHKDGKTRFYNGRQLERLQLIKRLIDQGHPISTLVDLDEKTLCQRLNAQRHASLAPARCALIGPNLLVLEQRQTQSASHPPRLDIRARWANLDAFVDDRTGTEPVDVVVLQLPVLLTEHVEKIGRYQPGARVVALYQFATPRHLNAVQELGVPTLQWPTNWAEIEHACATTAGMPLRAARAAARRFTDEELIAIAASATDPSQCPGHLVELLSNLNAFAEYSMGCAEGPDDDDQQRALYQRVHTDTTQARAQLELALEALVDAEQLLDTPN